MNWFAGYRDAFLGQTHRRFVTRRPPTRTVYCISEGLGMPVKVGISGNLRNRQDALRSATWRDVAFCWTAPGDSTHENAIKRLLRDRNLRCEWFSDADDAIKTMVPAAATQAELEQAINWLAGLLGNPAFYPPPQRRVKSPPALWLSRAGAA